MTELDGGASEIECPFCGQRFIFIMLVKPNEDGVVSIKTHIECSCGATYSGGDDE